MTCIVLVHGVHSQIHLNRSLGGCIKKKVDGTNKSCSRSGKTFYHLDVVLL